MADAKTEENDKGIDPEFEKDPDVQKAKLLKLNWQDLINYAEKRGIDTYGRTKVDLLTELGVTAKKGGKVFIRPQPSPEKMRYLLERNYPVPQNTIFPEEDFDQWLEIVAELPFAFNGADLTDKKAWIQHTLKAKVKCTCGATVIFPKHPETGLYMDIVMCPGINSTIMRRGRPVPIRKCISVNQFRKFIHHYTPSEE